MIAPGLTPRGKGDRVKTDRKDAELLARCLIAGSLHPIVVPAPAVEAGRELTRAHDACRRDLMNARHRVSKMLLRHGRVYREPSTWTQRHRRWLAGQQFSEPMSELDLGGSDRVRGRADRPQEGPGRADLACLRPTRPGGRPLPGCARSAVWTRSRRSRSISSSALTGHRFEKPTRVGSWLGLTPSRAPSPANRIAMAQITKTGSMLARRLLVESAWQYAREPLSGSRSPNRQEGQPDHVLQISNRAQHRLHHLYTRDAGARQAAQRHDHRRRTRTVLLPLGSRNRTLTTSFFLKQQHPGSGGRDAGPVQRPARAMGRRATPNRVRRSFLEQRTAGSRNRAMGYSEPPHFRLATPSPSPTSRPPETPSHKPARDQLTATLRRAPS